MNTKHTNGVGDDVMKAIREGHVHMRPRWHFLLLSALTLTGAILAFLTLLYIVSLGVFFLRDSGALFAPSFGARGWLTLLRSLPWLLIGFVVIFFVILEYLVKRYAFVYKKPLLLSVSGILCIVFIGGVAIARTPLHHTMLVSARHGFLPAPLSALYGHPLRQTSPDDMYHGQIVDVIQGGFVLVDEDTEDGHGTTTVLLTPRTRLPYGEDFTLGERVVVVGDEVATGTIQAFGVREIDEYPNQ